MEVEEVLGGKMVDLNRDMNSRRNWDDVASEGNEACASGIEGKAPRVRRRRMVQLRGGWN